MTKERFAAALSTAFVLAFPAAALGSPSTQQYANPMKHAGPPAPTTTPSPPTAPGALPFTGENLALVVAVGMALVGVGLVLRRFGSRRIDLAFAVPGAAVGPPLARPHRDSTTHAAPAAPVMTTDSPEKQPSTGESLALAVVVGMALAGVSVGLKRLGRPRGG
jgi:hypothetical protein